ncbi:MAG: HNH endonuclease [Chthoniobacterales bacterium]
MVRQRVNQYFFRATVLASYNTRCCITGLTIRELLVASHIVPWATDHANRVNPRNGLCLNSLHDRAFDRGLIAVSKNLRVSVSPTLKAGPLESAAKRFLLDYEDSELFPPDRFLPDPTFLEWHRSNVFQA